MDKNIENFVYLDSGRYISLESLKYIWILAYAFVSFLILVYGIVGKAVSVIIAIFLWNLLYGVFYLIVRSKKILKTFSLRFLVNGISSAFMSALFLILGFAMLLATRTNTLAITLSVFISFSISILVYISVIVLCVRKDRFANIVTKKLKRIDTAVGVLISVSCTFGVLFVRIIFSHFEIDGRMGVYIFVTMCELIALLSSLGFVNFIQYYYCKKYAINCDENGDTTSDLLEPAPKKKGRKKRSLFSKMLIAISIIALSILALLLLIGIFINQ